jgi:glycolate oxidase FAD binding subunit
MSDIKALLDSRQQMLSFEPPDWSSLLGSKGAPTLGGVVACNLAGPRRVRAGSARDYVLGFTAINGRGESWKAGGKVVKNVTGYDLCKLQTGAFGTLSLLTELTLKVMPKPESACTLLIAGLDDEAAIASLAAALNSPHEVSAAAHLPEASTRRCKVLHEQGVSGAVTAIRVEGPLSSVMYRVEALEALQGRGARLGDVDSQRFWNELANMGTLLNQRSCVWKICPTPSAAPALVAAVKLSFPSAEAVYDWGGGLVWIALETDEAGLDAGASLIRKAVEQVGGHATLVRAAETIRARTPVFPPLSSANFQLQRRVKVGFDPMGVLNPGRMHEGF